MKTSEQINELAAALSKAQSGMSAAKKGSVNPFFKSNYSDLASVMQAIAVPFADNELSFVQGAENQDGMILIITRIMHSSGQFIESSLLLPTTKNDPQAFGSAITYGKRYGLQALAGVPSADDDGQYASASTQKHDEEVQAKFNAEVAEYTNTLKKYLHSDDTSSVIKVWSEIDKNAARKKAVYNSLSEDDKTALTKIMKELKS